MKFSLVVVGVLAVAVVDGACPNSCSNAGYCGNNDQCECYNTHKGNDCSQRTCPKGKAWQTTSQGDINYDGDLADAAIYDSINAFQTRPYVVTDSNQGGTWEYWPPTGPAAGGEGHYMMECSNAGLCNGETGECQCFDGFQGYNCDRMACPNDCGQNGRCMTLSEQLAEADRESGSTTVYTLWDHDMIRSCLCDPGFTGIDCAQRVCAKGDDPLTKVNQVDSTQVVRIYSDDVDIIANTGELGGFFTMTYKSPTGEKFTTTDIALERFGKPGSTLVGKEHSVAVATKAALEALPNGNIPSVTVSAGFCEEAHIGVVADDFIPATTTAASAFMRCPGVTVSGSAASVIVSMNVGGSAKTGFWSIGPSHGGLAIAVATTSETLGGVLSGCTQIVKPRCIELTVRFSDPANTGDQELLKVDVTKSTLNSLTNVQNLGAGDIAASISRTRALTVAAATTALTKQWVTGVSAEFISTSGSYTSVTKTITVATGTGATLVLPAGLKIDISCQAGGAGPVFYHGRYTVDTTVTTGATGSIILMENLVDHQGRCSGAGNVLTLITKGDFITTDVDLSQAFDVVGGGYNINVGGSLVASSIYAVVPFAASVQYLLLTESLGTDIGSGTNQITLNGAGTKEALECSSRGVCDLETGICKCFKGYYGERCDTQNALQLGE